MPHEDSTRGRAIVHGASVSQDTPRDRAVTEKNPVNWLPIMQLKDCDVGRDTEVSHAEIGQGNLIWPAFVEAAEADGYRWFCMKQDTCSGDPCESVALSFQYLKENLCSS